MVSVPAVISRDQVIGLIERWVTEQSWQRLVDIRRDLNGARNRIVRLEASIASSLSLSAAFERDLARSFNGGNGGTIFAHDAVERSRRYALKKGLKDQRAKFDELQPECGQVRAAEEAMLRQFNHETADLRKIRTFLCAHGAEALVLALDMGPGFAPDPQAQWEKETLENLAAQMRRFRDALMETADPAAAERLKKMARLAAFDRPSKNRKAMFTELGLLIANSPVPDWKARYQELRDRFPAEMQGIGSSRTLSRLYHRWLKSARPADG
jgi:hypothetical protein